MLFTKSAPVVSRSTFAAQSKSKKFWGPANQTQPGPSFFVSTPQFTRQQTQLSLYVEDGRGTGSSGNHSDPFGVDNPLLALTGGANSAPAVSVGLVDDKEEEPMKRRLGKRQISPLPRKVEVESALTVKAHVPPPLADEVKADPLTAVIDRTGKLALVDSVLRKMQHLQSIGSHRAVLDTFGDLETLEANPPIEAYNMVLRSLASSGDANALLEGYEQLLARGVLPNESTYAIVINGLVDVATSISAKLSSLEPLLGPSTALESVEEIREGLSAEEYLALALAIMEPVVASHAEPLHSDLQTSLDSLVSLCIDYNIAVPKGLLTRISDNVVTIQLEPSITSAVASFSALPPAKQQSESAQIALMTSYFRFDEPAGGMAFFTNCGHPRYLLEPLLTGFASRGLVGTCRRWLQEFQPSTRVVSAVLKSIPLSSASKVLPSAKKIFFQLVSGGGGADGDEIEGRCAFIRLCVAAKDTDALIMAIKESKYSEISWDATTIAEAVQYMISVQQPVLAADICAWQVPKLSEAYSERKVRSFVEEEVISDAVRALQQADLLSLDTAFRLLPVVLVCLQARKQVVDLICCAKLAAPHEVANLINSENIANVVKSLSSLLLSSALRATSEEVEVVTRALPLFVEDALALKAGFTHAEADDIHEALKLCKNSDSLASLWLKRVDLSPSDRTVESPSEMSRNIIRYARAPQGLDYALQLLKDQLRLKVPVANEAFEAVIEACASSSPNGEHLRSIFSLVPRTPAVLNALIQAAAPADSELALECYEMLAKSSVPNLHTYSALVGSSLNSEKTREIFAEAKRHWPLTAGIYNSMASVLAKGLHKRELTSLMAEMSEHDFALSPLTYGHIINMSISLDEGEQALTVLKSVPTSVKSLLDVKVFNDLMSYFVEKYDRDSVLKVFFELRNTGTLATTHTYRLLMSAYLLRDDSGERNLNNADRVLSLMRQDGSPIPAKCFATLLHARGVLYRDFEGAINFYRAMVKNSRVLPDKSVFNALVESYITNGHEAELSAVLNEMKRYHVDVDNVRMPALT